MGRCYTPSAGPDSWRELLAKPWHWKTGHSAKALAHSWEAHDQLPEEVGALIKTAPRYASAQPELLMAVPEWVVPLPGGSRGSHNDILALIGVESDLVVCTVEGKVSESFDVTIEEWFSNPSKGKKKRLRYLCDLLGLVSPPPSHLRYQLFHRTASAVVECKRFRGQTPAMIVHSFSPEKAGFEDYEAFVTMMGGKAEPDLMTEVSLPDGHTLLLGWACGDYSYLRV